MPSLFAVFTLLQHRVKSMHPVLSICLIYDEITTLYIDLCWLPSACSEIFILRDLPLVEVRTFADKKHLIKKYLHLRYSERSDRNRHHVKEEDHDSTSFRKHNWSQLHSAALLHNRALSDGLDNGEPLL